MLTAYEHHLMVIWEKHNIGCVRPSLNMKNTTPRRFRTVFFMSYIVFIYYVFNFISIYYYIDRFDFEGLKPADQPF